MVEDTYSNFGVRNKLRHIEAKCVPCRKSSQRNVFPMMADLPKIRMDFTRSFKNTGADYFGPSNLKVRRSFEKDGYV